MRGSRFHVAHKNSAFCRPQRGELCVTLIFIKKSSSAIRPISGWISVNKQNCQKWGNTNPHELQERPMPPEKVTSWCGFWAGGVFGPYFFENNVGQAITINGERSAGWWLPTSLGLNWMIWTPTTCGLNRMALRATQLMPHWTFGTSDFRAWSPHVEVMRIGHRDRVIWPCKFFSCGVRISHKTQRPSKLT